MREREGGGERETDIGATHTRDMTWLHCVGICPGLKSLERNMKVLVIIYNDNYTSTANLMRCFRISLSRSGDEPLAPPVS